MSCGDSTHLLKRCEGYASGEDGAAVLVPIGAHSVIPARSAPCDLWGRAALATGDSKGLGDAIATGERDLKSAVTDFHGEHVGRVAQRREPD